MPELRNEYPVTGIKSTEVIAFPKQLNGYDRNEVDCYIQNLAGAYQTAYDEYHSVCAKYDDLLEKQHVIGEQHEQNELRSAVITKTLVDAETLAQKVIADAHAEADNIKAEAQIAAQRIKEEAYIEKAAAKMQAQITINEANSEASAAQEQARKIISDSRTEANLIKLRFKQDREQVNEAILKTINALQDLVHKER
jgi:cell division septum initiation protein DivIVA